MHPYIPELKDQYRQGRVTRREFMRMAALLGLSMTGISTFLTACGPKETETPAASTNVPVASNLPRRGGILTGMNLCQRLDDIATTQFYQYDIYRNVAEFLTVTNQDNITVPWLVQRWEPSEDLKTWTFYLQQGVKFNHGPEFTADDVLFNFQRWLDPNVGTAATQLFSYLSSANNVEKVDTYTFRLHLDSAQVAVPEHLYHYNCAIMPKDFEPPWSTNPVGTGPYTLDEYREDERAVLRRREGYWRNGVDGQPLPYLDGINFIALPDPAAQISALTTGELDLISITASSLDALEGQAGIVIASQVSAFGDIIRMRADRAPFDDVRVRNAIKACQDRAKFLEATYRGYGALAEDHPVAPVHPEYCPMTPPPRDLDKARALLAEAGYGDGLEVLLNTIDREPYITVAQLLKEQCEPAGITINLNIMPASMYWDQWTEVDFGITDWMHRPLAIMVLELAYRTGVPWNETHWSHPHFDDLLTQAEATYDVEARREIMCEIQNIFKEEGPIAVPCWFASLAAHRDRVKGFRAAPAMTMLDDVWLDDEA